MIYVAPAIESIRSTEITITANFSAPAITCETRIVGEAEGHAITKEHKLELHSSEKNKPLV